MPCAKWVTTPPPPTCSVGAQVGRAAGQDRSLLDSNYA